MVQMDKLMVRVQCFLQDIPAVGLSSFHSAFGLEYWTTQSVGKRQHHDDVL
ncbi:MAG: hypothetical protein NWR43_03050 [Alphaproteobacteria bacterium]|nr:hypothetical protein [Alphaproteobacteria bacterium]